MKKLFITLIILALTVTVFSQPVARQKVVIENFTADWCSWCPSAHQGIEDLIANGYDVAPLAYHGGGDPFQTTATQYRHSYYNVGGIPHSQFDGVVEEVGGSTSGTTYGTYLPVVQGRLAIPCDYTLSIYGQNVGLDYNISVILDLENGTPPDDLTLQFILCENHIPYSWQGQSECLWVVREMYPDHFGTDIDFAGGDQLIIDYNFTIDASWNADNIEFTAFLQNESDKEILQGNWVPKTGLVPLEASANFSSSTTQPCETTTVDFYDNSLGLITTWDWVFEGGIPATSTLENPVVTYNTTGQYDVQLTVFDGTTTDAMLMTDYIDVITLPAQASTPSGPVNACGGSSGNTYTTTAVPYADDYTWEINPSSAGTIVGNGLTATVAISATFSGTMNVTVRADNQCGEGLWSSAFTTTVYIVPVAYWMSDGAEYCTGTQGVEVTLGGSETGANYDLLLGGTSTGIILAGTGDVLDFGYQMGPGIYSINASTDFCESTMYGNAYIRPLDMPGQAAPPYGNEAVCSGDEETYSTNGAEDADSYVWTIDPAEAGIATGLTTDVIINWSATWSGTATAIVMGVNDCGDGTASDPFSVEVNALPEPVISGEEYVYANSTHTYSSPDHAQANYTWIVDGGSITAGQGTSEITVTWGGPGTGSVNLSEMSATDCEGIAVELIINIDPVGVEESFMTEVSLYPNPTGETLNVELYSQKDATVDIHVMNQVGQVVIHGSENLSSGNNKFVINTSDLQNGYYTIKMIAEDGTAAQQKFIVMK